MWFVAIVVGALMVAVFRLTTRYRYGPRSRRLLTAEVAGSLLVGLGLSRWWLFASATGVYFILAGLAVSVVVFILAALTTAEVLRKNRQRVFDERLLGLQVQEQTLTTELNKANRMMQAETRREEVAGSDARARDGRLAADRQRIETWKHASGAARIRSLKIEEWEGEFQALDPAGLDARQAALEAERSGKPDPERGAQIEVLLALVNIARDSVRVTLPVPVVPEPGVRDLVRRRRELEDELVGVRAELGNWQRRLADFLAKEIVLD
jgi:hypothetical protein